MRKLTTKVLTQQAKDFYKEARYIPSNYDALFHHRNFSSPVTIRKHFGSWDDYLDHAFNGMVLNYDNKMFYGGYGMNYKTIHPHELDPNITIKNVNYNILGGLTYDNISPKESWVTKFRWNNIIEILRDMNLPFGLVPAEKRFLTPFAILDVDYAIGSFDTPHIKNHYKRTTKVIEWINSKYSLLNLNGVKKNHIKKAIERLLS